MKEFFDFLKESDACGLAAAIIILLILFGGLGDFFGIFKRRTKIIEKTIRVCGICGEELKDEARYCPKCSAKMQNVK